MERAKRAKVKEEVIKSLGPPDPTIVVEAGEDGLHLSVQDLLAVFKEYGEVVLVR